MGILQWYSDQWDDHYHVLEKSSGVVILNAFLARFRGLLSCSPCGWHLRLEATLTSCVVSVTPNAVQMAFR